MRLGRRRAAPGLAAALLLVAACACAALRTARALGAPPNENELTIGYGTLKVRRPRGGYPL